VGGVEISASLDKMANSVAVAYSFVAAGTQAVGGRKTTAWSTDTTSQGVYGTKEYLSSASGLTDAAAEAQRDVILALRKYPQASATQTGGNSPATVTIECRGWWETLDWKYYPAGFPTGPSYAVTAGSTTQNIGQTGTYLMLTQTFEPGTIPFKPTSVWFYVSKTVSAPTSPITVYIQRVRTVGGLTQITTMFTGSIPAASVGTSIGWVECVAVTSKTMVTQAGDTYRILVYGNAALGATYYTFGVNEALGYTSGSLRLHTTKNLLASLTAGSARATDADLLFQIDADTSVYPDLLAAAAIGSGEFITGYDLESPTATAMSAYQDGDSTLRQLAEAMMLVGGASGRRLLSTIDINRFCRMYEEPVATATYRMDREGVLTTITGGQVIPYCPPIGAYVQMTDIIPATADLGLITDPTIQFIEGATWNESGGLSIQFKGEDTIELLTKVAMDHPGA
jgi:hypothetical protein